MFKRIMELISSGEAFAKLGGLLLKALPGLIVGVLLIAAYFVTTHLLVKKGKSDILKIINTYLAGIYLLFLVVLWLSGGGTHEKMVFDYSFAMTPGDLLMFFVNIVLLAPLGFLATRVWNNYAIVGGVCAGACVVLEVLQLVFKLGAASLLNIIAMLIGVGVGVLLAYLINKKAATVKQ